MNFAKLAEKFHAQNVATPDPRRWRVVVHVGRTISVSHYLDGNLFSSEELDTPRRWRNVQMPQRQTVKRYVRSRCYTRGARILV